MKKQTATVFGRSDDSTRIREVHAFGWIPEFDDFCAVYSPDEVTVWGASGPDGAVLVDSQDGLRDALEGRMLAWAAGAALVDEDAAAADPEGLAEFWIEVDEAESRRRINRNTARSRSRDFAVAVIRSLPLALGCSLATEIGKPLVGLPVFVVAAGPSLAKNKHLLTEARKRGPVFVVNTAAKAVDCEIDLLVTIENKDVSDHWAGVLDRVRAVSPSFQCHESAFKTGRPTLPFFTPGSPMTDAARMVGANSLPAGPCVPTAAVCLAQQLGASTVVLVGQDCAYTGGLTHAVGTHYDGQRAPKTSAFLPAWGGDGEVPSRGDLVLFARWFEGHARRCAALGVPTEFVNCTEGGARLDGWTERTLADEIDRWPEVVLPDLLSCSDGERLDETRVHAFMREISSESADLMASCAEQIASGDLSPMTTGASFVDAWATPGVMAALTSGASAGDKVAGATWAWLLAATEVQNIAAEWLREVRDDDRSDDRADQQRRAGEAPSDASA